MKKLGLGIGVIALSFMSFTSPSTQGGDDICKIYFPQQIGTELTYENFNAKDKLESTDKFKVLDVVEVGNATRVDVAASSYDKKGEEVYNGTLSYTCEDGVFKISMESMMDPAVMDAYKDMEITMTQTEIMIPSKLDIGAALPDAEMTMTVSSNGTQVMQMNFKITERKVEAIESITTPAGTFECYKLTQTTNMKMLFINKTFTSIDWISDNIGSVRSEMYDSKGSLESYRILSNINQ